MNKKVGEKSLMFVPEWYLAGFEKEDGIEYPQYECSKCGITCNFLLKGEESLPDMCVKRASGVKSINTHTEGEPINEREAYLLKTFTKKR
ncbi:hypothetical protein L6270_00695 [Candidatus Parcubacteria bacterium]|nr:hypothetical protein [Patescibacteria group bacterium]MBU4309668.1 hypothetical protein [Patescibacteria group bacterium]MBU4432008.1 hypothetical protein [Patescibacteria group bacterium]MBU4577944.1 hypothetical protein [Patescibacteria group bacterium]MCG2696547.1 hypothetical protein [Candidatus Parcubacteria bacterium]